MSLQGSMESTTPPSPTVVIEDAVDYCDPKSFKAVHISPSQSSFMDMVTILEEDRPFEITAYPHVLSKPPSVEDAVETGDKSSYSPGKRFVDASPSKNRTSIILVEEVIAKALQSVVDGGLPHLLPMIVLTKESLYEVEGGEEHESARDSDGNWTAQDISTEHISVATDTTPYQFHRHFRDKTHENYIASNKTDNPVLLSVCCDDKSPYEPMYRIILRTIHRTWHNEYSARSFNRVPTVGDFISLEQEGSNDEELALEDIQLVQEEKAPELLQKFDEHTICTRYKFGVMYQKFGQKTESEMFGNEHHSESMEEFLNLMGKRVQLKGFKHYKAGLDTNNDMTGKESVYATFKDKEIMFHVSSLLPYEPLDRQQIERKRHIGNDVVCIIFQDENTPFCPSSIRSHFLHVFIVVQVEHPNTPDTIYKVSVASREFLGPIEPALPVPAVFKKGPEFREFILTKLINAEIVARGTSKFKELNMRTRQQLLVQLVRELSPNPEKKKRGRIKSDHLVDYRAKTKRKPSLNLGSLLLGRVKDVSSEYLLSPRINRKKATDIVHMTPSMGHKDMDGSSEDLLVDRAATGPSPKHELDDSPVHRSLTVQNSSDTNEATVKENGIFRNRAHSQGEGSKTSLQEENSGEGKKKIKKSIFARVKTLSTKRKIRISAPIDNNNVTLVGLTSADESIVHSMEDVRVTDRNEVPSWSNFKPVMYRPVSEVGDGDDKMDKDVGYPLSQSVPSSPLRPHRSFSYTSASLAYVDHKPMYYSKDSGLPKPGAFSPLAHTSTSTLRRPKSQSIDSFSDVDERTSKVKTAAPQPETPKVPTAQLTMNNDTLGLLLKKIEELNDEVARVRKENFDLLKKQTFMYAANQQLSKKNSELENKLLAAKLNIIEAQHRGDTSV